RYVVHRDPWFGDEQGHALGVDFIGDQNTIHHCFTIQLFQVVSSPPITSRFALRTSGRRNSNGSSASFSSQRSSESCASRRPSSSNRFESRSTRGAKAQFVGQ